MHATPHVHLSDKAGRNCIIELFAERDFEADAGEVRFDVPFDVVYSRFGVMFFSDPVAAFQNLRSALGPEGRLAFV